MGTLLLIVLIGIGIAFAVYSIGIAIVLLPFFLMFMGWFSGEWWIFWVGLITLPFWFWLMKKLGDAKEEREAKAAARKAQKMNKYMK
ncbi:hypothetical protein [Heyndrickxia acidicola]|uniref:Uncharacterized protein n=1 Tax=Heyndrickxia acidicola TaxID=209389 RepID=A0ABU6MMF3_9BACI|nr:hypothetical protein [Heyndrickxia acidicola]MED1205861.1 hypothetical protein [Heyndrickxia acidicola]